MVLAGTSRDGLRISSRTASASMRSKTDYLDFYGRLKDFPLAVSRETGALLYMLARSSAARTVARR